MADISKLMEKRPAIYKMGLHDVIQIRGGGGNQTIEYVYRVPGGWVYIFAGIHNTSSVFVPYDNEFIGRGNE